MADLRSLLRRGHAQGGGAAHGASACVCHVNEPFVHSSDRIASFVIPLPYRLPSPNGRMHPLERARQVRMVRDYIALATRSKRNELRLPVATERRALRLTRYYAHPEHEMDPDNCMASMKA